MCSITLILVATVLLLAIGAHSFAGEEGGAQHGCQSTCTNYEAFVAPSTQVKGFGPKGGPIGKQIVVSYLGSQSAIYLAPTAEAVNAGPIPGAKGQVRWPARGMLQEQALRLRLLVAIARLPVWPAIPKAVIRSLRGFYHVPIHSSTLPVRPAHVGRRSGQHNL